MGSKHVPLAIAVHGIRKDLWARFPCSPNGASYSSPSHHENLSTSFFFFFEFSENARKWNLELQMTNDSRGIKLAYYGAHQFRSAHCCRMGGFQLPGGKTDRIKRRPLFMELWMGVQLEHQTVIVRPQCGWRKWKSWH